MSSDVQQCEPVPETRSPQKRKSLDRQDLDADEPEPKKTTTHLFAKLQHSIIACQYSHLSKLSSQIELALLEKYFLDNRLVYSDYPKWLEVHSKTPRNKILRDYLISHFNPTELNTLSDKCSARLDLKLAVSAPAAWSSSAEQFKSIAECAKHEAQVLQRISELRKHGLWSIKRLPKLVEPARAKTHWDYLLDEMVWMSSDFVQERKWKVNTCRKISAAVQKYFKEREARCETAERDQQKRVRKQAGLVAKEIQQFWKQVAKLIEYKQRSISEEKRKIQMDQHLNFIVDQTEKYSSWLVESLNQSKERSDDEVSGPDEVSDAESTIQSDEDRPVDDELTQLRQESQLDLNVLLKDYNLDESYFCQNFQPSLKDEEEKSSESDETEDEAVVSDDMSEEEDDEETIEQDEKMDNEYDAQQELAQLKTDFELPIEQLLEKLKKPSDEKLNASSSTDQNDGLDSIAAHAESFQPTGYTLETTHVKTRIPSELLKHSLREYQHVGLDWLVTMYENKLNGILADEMGLGKTIQTIALLAHLAVDKAIWGPHLIVVPTSVMLNWELEFKKWSPGFKILTYYGSQKERKLKRIGWTKTNAFHVCITSYKLVIQDHAIFRRKKWKYFILDEAQNIKNFKSQRWQTLLNFQSQRRLLLTGTPLQNNLMELWSLMHFLMPHVFASHRQFNHWFNNPFKTMVEKSSEVNEQLIKRLHKVLRPFILRRLKADVEKQMPKKYEHVIKCALSKRQRLLYDEFMSLSSTRQKIAQGHYMSVINILMQLRKVCNHPDLFEPRPIVSSFVSQPLEYQVPSMVFNLADELCADQPCHYHPGLADMETMSAFDSHRAKRLQVTGKHIEQSLVQAHPKPHDHVTTGNFFQDKTLVGIKSSSVHSSCPQQHLTISDELSDRSIKANYLARLNKLRFIFHRPVYGRDLVDCVSNLRVSQCDDKSFATRSYATCEMSRASRNYLEYTDALRQSVNLVRDYLMHEMECVCEKFVMYVPNVRYSSSDYVTLRIANPHPALYRNYTNIKRPITNVCVRTGFARLNQIVDTLTSTHFPDKRLIQYDCGKLQKLDSLLRQLYSGEHRVLLFTQMTRMLDVLENFLNYHGYKYLRLDGATSIEQRQVLMERFNTDTRIFCFILSTRSGGVGVNLTGADTVVFYDSDWNPTMDAQAQDRCHRIGQTRDVHIYRLISEKTVEENILKKADQKRLLSQMAIEGGCFTTAVLRQSHITELFEEHQDPVSQHNNESSVGQIDDTKFEEALGMVEDESDVNAAKNLRQEVQADIAEFDENDNLTDDPDMAKLHTEFKFIETELKPIERYALKYLESTGEVQIENDAEPDIEQVKKSWELERLKQLKEEEERRAEQEEEDLMYTYTKTEIWINDYSDQMPLWCPLTPPSNDRDVYIDTYDACNYLYDSEPIAEELLPPVTYSKRGDKRLKIDLISPSKQKQQNLQNIQSQTSSQLTAHSNQSIAKSSIKSLENIIIPRPLFDKTNTTLIKLRRDVKMQKLKGWPTFKMDIVKSTLPIQPEFSGKDDWLPNDDFNIIYALQVVLELPLNLQAIAPSHQVNWDLVSDMVSSGFTKQYRSPQECRKRFENVILKREELCLTEIQNKKQQMLQAEQSATKIKTPNKPVVLNITKTKTLRTNQLYLQDNYKQLVQNQNRRFDKITSIGKKRHQSQFSIFSVQQPTQFTAYSLQQPLGPAQQLNHQNLLSRFNSSLPQTPIVSSFVTNATYALITAIKQTHAQTTSINAESIHFRTPKYFSDMKVLKEKQAKQASLVVTSPVPSHVPASPSQSQAIKQNQTASPTPSAHKNQTILSHLQQQQRATSALAAQLAASAAAVAQQSIEKPKLQQTSPMTPSQPQTVQQHLQKPQSISAIIQNQQNQTIFYQNQQAQSQSSLRSLVQSTSPATQTINQQQQQQQQQQQPQITIAVPISSSGSGSGSQTISSIISNQQLHQSSGQQAIRFYSNQSNKNSSLNELRKKTTVAGITAAAAAAASSVQPPQSPSQVSTQTKQLIQQQKINKQMQQQMGAQKPASHSPVVVAQQQTSGQQNVPTVQRSSPATSILIRQNPQSNMPKATIQQTIQQIQQQQQQSVQAVKQEETIAKQNPTSNAQNQASVQTSQQTPQVITVQSANSNTNVNTVQNIVNRQQGSTGQPSTITTLIKPINNVSLSNQQKQGIIMTNQPQFRQFQLMSNSSSQNSQNGQVVIQQPNIVMNTNTGQPQTTIRKVGSSTNISTLQQKVQVINRGNIQIVQANSGQRLTKTTPLNTSVSSSTPNSTPIQFQQAFQQQTAKQPAPNSNQTTSVSTLTSGATMPTLKTSTTSAQKSSSTPTTVKTLLASSNQAPNFSIIATSAGVNTSGIPQAIPINSSLSQVLRQLGNQNNLSINIQSLNSINASPIQLIQATSSNSGTNVSDSNENSNNSEPTLVVGSNNNSNLTSSQNENKQ